MSPCRENTASPCGSWRPDGGRTWVHADLQEGAGEFWAWSLWEAHLEIGSGEHRIVARALDSSAGTQPVTAEEV